VGAPKDASGEKKQRVGSLKHPNLKTEKNKARLSPIPERIRTIREGEELGVKGASLERKRTITKRQSVKPTRVKGTLLKRRTDTRSRGKVERWKVPTNLINKNERSKSLKKWKRLKKKKGSKNKKKKMQLGLLPCKGREHAVQREAKHRERT